jgi:inosine-uridine nucleoside N-ribohydrolase
MKRWFPRFAFCVLLSISASVGLSAESERIPILLDTDIGDEVDDAFALALVLTSPEFDLRGVTTVAGPANARATLACRLLDAVGRSGVPVAAGASTRTPKNEGLLQYGLRASPKRPVRENAVEFLYQQLKADPGNVTIVAVGPLTNVAALLEQHPDAKPWIKQIVLMGGAIRVGYEGKPPAGPEWNIKGDVAAARTVFSSGVPLVVAPLDAAVSVKLDAERRAKIFAADSLLCKHLQGLYELWGKETPTLYDPVAAALLVDESFCKIEALRLEIADDGATRVVEGKPNARVATSIRSEAFLAWFEQRVMGLPLAPEHLPRDLVLDVDAENKHRLLGYPIELPRLESLLSAAAKHRKPEEATALVRGDKRARTGSVQAAIKAAQPAAGIFSLRVLDDEPKNVSKLVSRRGLPARVHVFEDYETEIERRWWLAGKPESRGDGDSNTYCRAMLCRNFDGKMGDKYAIHRAVIFNPVPGPPMGPNTRLSFRYKLSGTDQMRVQIYSLSNGYHRFLTLTDLPQDMWREATVDMTDARRPDGSGGPLSDDERIDDIQFYIDPNAELLIDDIVLYDEAAEGETVPFPARFLFTGWFDTGKQGVEWPGKFETVPHEAPRKWKAAKSIPGEDGGPPQLRVSLRGSRPLSANLRLRFRYRLSDGKQLSVALVDSEGKAEARMSLVDLIVGSWAETELAFALPPDSKLRAADEVRFEIPAGAELLIDDLLLYEPGKQAE